MYWRSDIIPKVMVNSIRKMAPVVAHECLNPKSVPQKAVCTQTQHLRQGTYLKHSHINPGINCPMHDLWTSEFIMMAITAWFGSVYLISI